MTRPGRQPAPGGEVRLPRDAVIDLARLLDVLVVSGDRIGSYHGASLDDCDRELGRWIRESGLSVEAARLREPVRNALVVDSVAGDEALDADLGDLPYWRPPDA